MRIERGDLADAGMVRACHEVYDAALRADKAEGPWLTAGPFSGWLSVGWMGDPREVWLVTDQAAGGGAAAGGGGAREGGRFTGAVAGWYRLELPDRENLDRAQLDLMVHPDRRRRGLGRMLLQHAATRAAAHGRSVLSGAAQHGSAPEIWDAQRAR